MSNSLTKTNVQINKVSQEAEDAVRKIKAHTENPFRCLDPEWIPPVVTFGIAKGKLIESMASFCLLIQIQKSKGLTLSGLKAVLKRLTDAEVAATHNFENQLIADFHAWCAVAIRNQRRKDEAERLREAEKNPDGGTAVVLSLVKNIGTKTQEGTSPAHNKAAN